MEELVITYVRHQCGEIASFMALFRKNIKFKNDHEWELYNELLNFLYTFHYYGSCNYDDFNNLHVRLSEYVVNEGEGRISNRVVDYTGAGILDMKIRNLLEFVIKISDVGVVDDYYYDNLKKILESASRFMARL